MLAVCISRSKAACSAIVFAVQRTRQICMGSDTHAGVCVGERARERERENTDLLESTSKVVTVDADQDLVVLVLTLELVRLKKAVLCARCGRWR